MYGLQELTVSELASCIQEVCFFGAALKLKPGKENMTTNIDIIAFQH